MAAAVAGHLWAAASVKTHQKYFSSPPLALIHLLTNTKSVLLLGFCFVMNFSYIAGMLIFSFLNARKSKLRKTLPVWGVLPHLVVIKENKSQEKCYVLNRKENGHLGWILRTAKQDIL